jgi:DNA end-binding protein Ku
MARAIWSGAISFGLVSVPVKAFTAVRPHSVKFHQLDPKGARVRYEKISEKTGKPVEDIQLGYERTKGKYVTFDPDEIAKLRPKATKTIDVGDFVDLADIDPIYYDSTYWLAPDGEAATKAYALLVDAMEDKQKVGVGSVVMRNRQRLAAVRPLDGALAMSTMHWADEIVSKKDVDGIPARASKPSSKEVALANQIIDSLSGDWNPKQYRDTYTEELEDLIERKAKGQKVTIEESPQEEGELLDLMAALEKSVEAARGRRKKTAARKPRAKKSA